jgi:hypothetical protein
VWSRFQPDPVDRALRSTVLLPLGCVQAESEEDDDEVSCRVLVDHT